MPQLDPASFPSQLFWLVVCFGTMLLVLSVFVLPRITRTLTARQGQIDGDLKPLKNCAQMPRPLWRPMMQHYSRHAIMRWLWHRTCVPKFRLKPTVKRQNSMPASQRSQKPMRLQAARDAALGGLDAAARDVVGDVMQAVGLGAPDDSDMMRHSKPRRRGDANV